MNIRLETAMAMNDTAPAWTKTRFGGAFVLMLRTAGVILAVALMIVAVPLFLMPIPLGLPLFALACVLLALSSKRAHAMITGGLKRHPKIWARVRPLFRE